MSLFAVVLGVPSASAATTRPAGVPAIEFLDLEGTLQVRHDVSTLTVGVTSYWYDPQSSSTTSTGFVATNTGAKEANPRDPVTDLPRDANGNIIGGVGGGRGRALSDAEAEAVRDFEAGGSPDQKLLNGAKDKLKGQEKYQGSRNKQKRGK